MKYSKKDIDIILERRSLAQASLSKITLKIGKTSFVSQDARRFAFYGYLRRLKTMFACIKNIFSIHPLRDDHIFEESESENLQINIQALVFNASGAFDNLAWMFVHEKGLRIRVKGDKLEKTCNDISVKDISLIKPFVRKYYSKKFSDYMDFSESKESLSISSKISNILYFRHPLAHRIPFYVPKSIKNKDRESYLLECSEFVSGINQISLNNSAKNLDNFRKYEGASLFIVQEDGNDLVYPYFHIMVLDIFYLCVDIGINMIEEIESMDKNK